MLANLVAASVFGNSNLRKYSSENHCEYVEMTVNPSTFEAHASRMYVIDDSLHEHAWIADASDAAEQGSGVSMYHSTKNSMHNTTHKSRQAQHTHPPSMARLFGVSGFGFAPPHPAQFMHPPSSTLTCNTSHTADNAHCSPIIPIIPQTQVPSEGDEEHDCMLAPGHVV